MKAFSEKIRARLSTEDEPFEGDVPVKDVEADVMSFITETKAAASGRCKFVFDGFIHSSAEKFINFTTCLGLPKFFMKLTASEKTLSARWCAKNETDEIGEEQKEAMVKECEEALKL